MEIFTKTGRLKLSLRVSGVLMLSLMTMATSWGQQYRTKASGDWSNPSVWERRAGTTGTFSSASVAPNADNSALITIQSTHNVTLSTDLFIDQAVIATGGTLKVLEGAKLKVLDGRSNDLTIGGALINEGVIEFGEGVLNEGGEEEIDEETGKPIFIPSAANIVLTGTLENKGNITYVSEDGINFDVKPSGIFIHNTIADEPVPFAIWDRTSTVKIVAVPMDIWTGLQGQQFGNLIWDTPELIADLGYYNLEGTLNHIQGDLTFLNTGSVSLYLDGDFNEIPSLIVDGNLRVAGVGTQVYLHFSGNTVADIGGNLTVEDNGVLNISEGAGFTTINLAGNLNYTGNGKIVNSSARGVLNFIGNISGKQTVNGTTSLGNSLIDFNVKSTRLVFENGSFLSGRGKFTTTASTIVEISSPAGIVTGTTSGNIRVSGIRTYAAGTNIIYNSVSPQFTGNGLTGDVNLEIANTSGVTLNSDLTINAGRTLALNGGNLNVGAGTLTLNGTTSGTGSIITSNTSNLSIGGTGALGTINIPSGVVNNFTLNRTTSGAATLGTDVRVAGALTLTNGILSINDKTLTLAGTADYTSGKLSGNAASKVVITGSGNLGKITFDTNGNTIGELSLARANAGTATIGGTLTVNNTLNLEVGSLTATALALADGSTIKRTTGTIATTPATTGAYNVEYVGGVTTGAELPTSATALRNLTINASGNTVTLNAARTVNGNFTIANGDFVQGANALTLKGNFNHTAGTYASNGAVILNGTSPQTISTNSALALNNLTVNKTGSNVVIGSNGISVEGALALTAGNVVTGANTLTLGASATISEGNNRYVVGQLATNRVVGSAGSSFGGMGVTLGAGVEVGTVSVVRTTGAAGAVTVDEVTGINRKWEIVPSTQPASPIKVTLAWVENDDNGTVLEDLRIWKTTGTGEIFTELTNTNTQSIANRTLSADVSQFSTFTVMAAAPNPLPVELISFTAKRKNENAELTWATASEKDNTGFEVQVSENGKDFRVLGFVETHNGNSQVVQKYTFIDREPGKQGIRYYRIKQIDVDGQEETFAVKSVKFEEARTTFTSFPNPFEKEFEVLVDAAGSKTITLTLTDALGKQVYSKTVAAEAGINRILIDLHQEAPAGLYILNVATDKMKKSLKVIKR